jgi:hypothetical protein
MIFSRPKAPTDPQKPLPGHVQAQSPSTQLATALCDAVSNCIFFKNLNFSRNESERLGKNYPKIYSSDFLRVSARQIKFTKRPGVFDEESNSPTLVL